MTFVSSIPDGTLQGTAPNRFTGPVARPPCAQSDPISASASDSPENAAVAELSALISSLGALSSQAQSLPLSPPTLPSLPQQSGYQPQVTDYSQFGSDPNA